LRQWKNKQYTGPVYIQNKRRMNNYNRKRNKQTARQTDRDYTGRPESSRKRERQRDRERERGRERARQSQVDRPKERERGIRRNGKQPGFT